MYCDVDLTVCICIDVKLRDVILGRGLDPDTLPDAAAGRVEDVRGAEGLLADWDHVFGTTSVCRVMYEDEAAILHEFLQIIIQEFRKILQFIGPVRIEVLCSINSEAEIASSVEACLLPVDVDCGFVVYSSEVKQDLSSGPRGRHVERCREPRINSVFSLDSCIAVNRILFSVSF